MLDALDIAHGEIKKLCAAQRELAGKVSKPKLEITAPVVDEGLLGEIQASHGAGAGRGDLRRGQARPPGRHEGGRGGGAREVLGRPDRRHLPGVPPAGPAGLRPAREDDHPPAHRGAQARARTGARREEIRADLRRGRPAAAHARLRALHPRPDAGPVRRRPRHDARGDAPGQPRARDVQALLPPLQLPALLGRGGGLHARPQAARHRPRRARRAGARADDPVAGGVPLHDPRRVGDPRVQRLLLHGLRLRLLALADGRRRAAQAARRRRRHGPHQGGRRLHGPDGHRGRGGPPRRHGLQGRRHGERHHRAADGHQDHRRHLRHPARRARPGEGGPAVHPRQDGRGDRRRRAASCPSSRRGSPPSRSTRTRSAC